MCGNENKNDVRKQFQKIALEEDEFISCFEKECLRLQKRKGYNMNEITVKNKVDKILSRYTENKKEDFGDEIDLIIDLGIDSLQMVQFIMDIEEKFGLDIGIDELNNIVKYDSLIKYIVRQVENK